MTEWHDFTIIGSAYEQQTDGVRWRHRPMARLPRRRGFFPHEADLYELPWKEGTAPDLK